MAFNIPTLSELTLRIEEDIKTRMGAGTQLRRSMIKVFAAVLGSIAYLIYRFLVYMSKQLFAFSADEEHLANIGDEEGVVIKDAVAASGAGEATTTLIGTIISAGSELQTIEGVVYTIDSDVTFTSSTATVNFTAKIPDYIGDIGNNDPSITLTFVSPITNVGSTVTVDSNGITGGVDKETLEAYRERILLRKRNPPHGGALHDYVAWALEVSEVTRAWAISEFNGPGTVGVAAVLDDNTTDIIPSPTKAAEILAYLQQHTDPATGEIIGAPVANSNNIIVLDNATSPFILSKKIVTLSVDIYPNTASVQAAITNSLADYILRNGGPEKTLYVSQIQEAISQANGEERHNITLLMGSATLANITATNTEVHTLGTITFGTL